MFFTVANSEHSYQIQKVPELLPFSRVEENLPHADGAVGFGAGSMASSIGSAKPKLARGFTQPDPLARGSTCSCRGWTDCGRLPDARPERAPQLLRGGGCRSRQGKWAVNRRWCCKIANPPNRR